MHDPTRFDAIWSPVPVEHQCLPHPYNLTRGRVKHRTILPRCFPVARCRRAIGSKAGCIFTVTEAEEVPFVCIELSHLWELPWLARVQVNFHQGTLQNFLISDLFVKVMKDQLLITRVKPKPWGQ